MERKALYAGSFDPLTNGHLNIIERAAGIFDKLTVAIAVNPSKSGMFSTDERAAMVKEAVKHLPNVDIDIFTGLIADYVNAKGFTAYVRGLRNHTDFESELQMAQMNALLFKEGTETVFLMTDPKDSFISSSLVKEVASLGGDVDSLVPQNIADSLRKKMTE
jgi:pantetheine-phosphate adenylyltransferase